MQCIGYDEAFQRKNVEEEYRIRAREAEDGESKPPNRSAGGKTRAKSKRVKAVRQADDDVMDIDDLEAIADRGAEVIPRGTRSRPVVNVKAE